MTPTRRRTRSAAAPAVLLALSLGAVPLAAQARTVAAGRVLLPGAADTLGVAGARVVLHRVSRQAQGPVDSVTAGPRGEFRFQYRADTSAVYLLSSGYAGIEYFSSPLHTNGDLPDTGLVLFVSDTSASAPIHVESRHIVISKPTADGTRSVLEIVVLGNDGSRTRVARDSLSPVWSARLPAGALAFQVGQGDVGPDGLIERGDSVILVSPVAPGQKQLMYTYALPANPGPLKLPITDSIVTANILLEEFDRTVTGGGIARADSQKIESRSFRQWAGPVAAGSVIAIDFPGSSAGWVLPLLVGVVAGALGFVGFRAMRQRPPVVPATAQPAALEQLARLDAKYAGKESAVPPEEWAAYQRDRARLKSELASELARKGSLS